MAQNPKIFLPGPTMVRPEVLAELSRPIIGHKTPEFRALAAELVPRLQWLMGTKYSVFPLTCTASAAMEAALLNAGGDKVLVLGNGGFGERWFQAAQALPMDVVRVKLDWGKPFGWEGIRSLLNLGHFDSVVLVHGETSTGMLNPIEPLRELLANYPDVLLIVDAVTTLGGVPLDMDKLKIDVLVGGSQKCLALPPGIVPVGVSERALTRSRRSCFKGYAFDFTLWHMHWKVGQVVGTPAIPQLHALNYQLKCLERETLPARWERHRRMLALTEAWAAEHTWQYVAPEGYHLPPVSCLRPPVERDTTPIVEQMRQRGYVIDDGFGRLKGKTLRLGHLGDWGEEDLRGLLGALTVVSRR